MLSTATCATTTRIIAGAMAADLVVCWVVERVMAAAFPASLSPVAKVLAQGAGAK